MNTAERLRYKISGKVWEISQRHPAIKEMLEFDSYDLVDLLRNVHPHLKDTPVLTTAVQLLCSLKPIVRHNPREYSLPGSNCLFRGSLIKRHELGDPEGYTDLHTIFKSYLSNPFDEANNVSRNVAEKLSHEPYEIDFRAEFSNRSQILPTLIQSLQKQGFVESGSPPFMYVNHKTGERARIKSFSVGTEEYPRTIYHIFLEQNHKPMLQLDIADLPNEIRYDQELRSSWTAGMFELEAMSDAQMHNGSITVHIPKALKKYRDSMGSRIVSQNYYTQAIGNGLRELGSWVFWLKTDAQGLYQLSVIDDQMRKGYIDRIDVSRITETRGVITEKGRALLTQRAESLMSDFLLYFTYDPFLFFYLGFHTTLFKSIPVGEFLSSEKNFNEILKLMTEEIRGSDHLSLAEISQSYKKSVLLGKEADIRNTGIFILIRALNKFFSYHNDPTRINETMDGAIDLINPLLMLPQQVDIASLVKLPMIY